MRYRRPDRRCVLALAVGLFALTGALATPAALDGVPIVNVPVPDLGQLRAEDAARAAEGLPRRFAVPHVTWHSPAHDGVWENIEDGARRWRLRITSPGARSLNLGFTAFWMPAGGELRVYSADGRQAIGPYTAEDNAAHGELWTPVVPADDVVIDVRTPAGRAGELVLELTAINVGYELFGEGGDRSGACNVDVICPEADPWRDEVPSVALISIGGTVLCSGFMVNNTAQNQVPYFMTADHCGLTAANAATLVVYWNYQSPSCGQHGGGTLTHNQSGAYFRAGWASSDFTLVELDSLPDPTWGVTLAGWDRSTANPTSAVTIHHPSSDEKSITFDDDPLTTTSYEGYSSPGDGTHLRVGAWDVGATEAGSSGGPLFNQSRRVVGQLHGGFPGCDSGGSHWFGRFSRSWTGGGTNDTRLSNWLDPLGTAPTALDTLVPNPGLTVTPETNLSATGPEGGPFAPTSKDYTLHNPGTLAFNYTVTKTVAWLSITNSTGTLGPGASVVVTVSINSNAEGLAGGSYSATVSFVNVSTHAGDTSRVVTLQVGDPVLVYNWNMGSNPGWTAEGQWAWGHPTGGGGSHGFPDPSSGYTGANVYGYNLNGDYFNNMGEERLTTAAIDCAALTGVRLKFRRWLGVERPSYPGADADHARLHISADGGSWTTIWENTAEVTDSAWVLQEFDIAGVANLQPAVYLRWTMGPTDSSWTYCGWNIDDVQIWGVRVCAPPLIETQPAPAEVCGGESIWFSVDASGSTPRSYQWRHNGNEIPGADQLTYTIPAVTAEDAGNYDCVVSNPCGAAISEVAVLTVNTPPIIQNQPDSASVCTGQQAVLDIFASGGAPLSYAWRHDGVVIPEATGGIFVIPAVAPADAGDYDCIVTNPCGQTVSAIAHLTVDAPPTISAEPDSAVACVGAPASFDVSAEGSPPLSYAWRKDGVPIGDANQPTYDIPAVAPGDAGDYDCVVTNVCGQVVSAAAHLTVETAPAILAEPNDAAVCVGAAAAFSVTAAGAPPLIYAWRKDGEVIADANQPELVFAAVTSEDAGAYDCLVNNACGQTASAVATLVVRTGPAISGPDSAAACIGGPAAFAVSAEGTAPLNYQWHLDGTPIPDANAPELAIAEAGPEHVGAYTCEVTDACGSTLSPAATLEIVWNVPKITEDPIDQDVILGAAAGFAVQADWPATWRWHKDGAPLSDSGRISGSATATLAIDPVVGGDAGLYHCVVSNACAEVTSSAAMLNLAPPLICRGDCDCDGMVGFSDIDYFVAAIPQNYAAWAARFPYGPTCLFDNCDVNGSGMVGFDDIDPFVALIPSACP